MSIELVKLVYVPDGQGLFKELKPALRFWNPPTLQLYYTINLLSFDYVHDEKLMDGVNEYWK